METTLRKMRKRHGLTLRQVSMATGVDISSICQAELRKKVIFPRHKKALADFFGLDPSAVSDEKGFARIEE